MADVIIRGMEMPPVCITEDGFYGHCPMDRVWCAQRFAPYWTRTGQAYKSMIEGRPDWGPLRPAQEWISVEEMLPNATVEGYGDHGELNESDLCYVYGYTPTLRSAYGIGRYIYDRETPAYSGWNGYMDGDYDLDYCNVTHWRPIPDPPKEANDGM